MALFSGVYEQMVRFASEGTLGEELARAKQEYIKRTGEIFESDASLERRLAAFLEWYTLDRTMSCEPHTTPLAFYLQTNASSLTQSDREHLEALGRSNLSIFEYSRQKGEFLHVIDLLTGEKWQIFERRAPVGLESKDIIEARTVPMDNKLMLADAHSFAPRQARRAILKAAKSFRKQENPNPQARLDLVHRVAYLINRCERYKHVDPKRIFAELA